MPTIQNQIQLATQNLTSQNLTSKYVAFNDAASNTSQNTTQNTTQNISTFNADYPLDSTMDMTADSAINFNMDSALSSNSLDFARNLENVDFAMSHAFFGVFVLFVLTFVAFNYTLKIQRFISRKLATKSRDKLKLAPYECGPTPLKQPAKIPNQFFIIALLFVLFDIEVVFMIPWAIVYKEAIQTSGFGILLFIEMISFILLLVVGLVYAWKKGALQLQEHSHKNTLTMSNNTQS